ncbi:MAG: alpha-1,2-fucosyltransferase [Lachnospiraceae bacterium]|nr:alpha-1,2-fucosyltransferase [Lachnospiraceae bacterium]
MKVLVGIKGGLGNQLFCYAFAYAVARKTNAKLYIDTTELEQGLVKDRKYELSGFDIKYFKRISYGYVQNPVLRKIGINRIGKCLAIGLGTKIYKEQKNYYYDEKVFRINNNTYFDGFWQNYHYFDSYRDEILSMLYYEPKLDERGRKLFREIEESDSVSLHVRRGDYIGLNWQIPMNYYDDALVKLKDYTCNLNGALNVFVFSDDIEFAKGYFSGKKYEEINFRYMDYGSENRNLSDMYLMSRCKHNIIANSSYSWWGAYTNRNENRITICPVIGTWDKSIYPDNWIKIEISN